MCQCSCSPQSTTVLANVKQFVELCLLVDLQIGSEIRQSLFMFVNKTRAFWSKMGFSWYHIFPLACAQLVCNIALWIKILWILVFLPIQFNQFNVEKNMYKAKRNYRTKMFLIDNNTCYTIILYSSWKPLCSIL